MSALTVEGILGGPAVLKRRPRSDLDWVALIRAGIPAAAVDSVIKAVHLSQAELGSTLGIPERTLARRKKEGMLSSEESAKLLRLARTLRRATEVFEDTDAALDWLKARNRALGGVTPLSLLDTDLGTEGVMDVLGRIEHGVYS